MKKEFYDGGHAWKIGAMRKENPYPAMTVGHARWDQEFMTAMENHYAEDLKTASNTTGSDQVDAPGVPGNSGQVR